MLLREKKLICISLLCLMSCAYGSNDSNISRNSINRNDSDADYFMINRILTENISVNDKIQKMENIKQNSYRGTMQLAFEQNFNTLFVLESKEMYEYFIGKGVDVSKENPTILILSTKEVEDLIFEELKNKKVDEKTFINSNNGEILSSAVRWFFQDKKSVKKEEYLRKIKLFIEKGANVSEVDNHTKWTVLEEAIYHAFDIIVEENDKEYKKDTKNKLLNILTIIFSKLDEESKKNLINREVAYISVKTTALIHAVRYNLGYDVCNLLIDNGANINAIDQRGKTALMYVSENKSKYDEELEEYKEYDKIEKLLKASS